MSARGGIAATSTGLAASALMQTLLANATPRMAAEFAAPAAYTWVSATYLIASTVTLPVFAQLADHIGPRRVFIAGHIAFGLGALGLSCAPTLPLVLAARAIQGLGAGALAPSALAALGLLFHDDRARAMGRVAAVQTAANVVGPLLGGWFVDGPGWRLGALVALPLSLLGLALSRSVPTAVPVPRWWRISLREQVEVLGEASLRRQVILAGAVGTITLGVITYAPLVMQETRGLSATATGVLLVFLLVATGLGAVLGGRLAQTRWIRPGAWALMVLGAPLVVAPVPVAAAGLVFVGLGGGASFPLILLDVQSLAPARRLAQAGGLAQLGRTGGAAAGIPALGLCLNAGLPLAGVLIFASIAAVALAGGILTLTQPKETA